MSGQELIRDDARISAECIYLNKNNLKSANQALVSFAIRASVFCFVGGHILTCVTGQDNGSFFPKNSYQFKE
jgi:hypothetical protein